MIRGSNRVISNRPPVASFGIHNRFDIEVIDVETGRLKQEARAYNVICNNLWTKLFANTAYFKYIHYGSGSGTPSSTDTALFSYVGGQSPTDETASIDYESGVYSLRKRIQLMASTAVGINITEVGIAYDTGSSTLCTHAMLEDMNGNRISITKTDTDVISIYATVYVHFNPNGYDGGYIRPVSCVPTSGLFACLCGNSNYYPDRMYMTASDTVNARPLSTGARVYDGDNQASYVNVSTVHDATNKTITFTPTRLESTSYNIGGFRYLNLWKEIYSSFSSNTYEPSCILRPGGSWFPYSQITSEAVGTGDGSTIDYSLKFPFVRDVKVYVDGVETTDFTYDYAPNSSTLFQYYMQNLHPDSTVDNHIHCISTYYQPSFPSTRLLYNPAYAVGCGTIVMPTYTGIELLSSDDLVTWDTVFPAATIQSNLKHDIPTEYAHRKYWKLVDHEYKTKVNSNVYSTWLQPPSTFTGKTLHFNTPPAEGAVITVDYKTDTIAKDENHVFDLSVTIQIGEYTGD